MLDQADSIEVVDPVASQNRLARSRGVQDSFAVVIALGHVSLLDIMHPVQVPDAAAAGARDVGGLPAAAADQVLLLQEHHLRLHVLLLPGLQRRLRPGQPSSSPEILTTDSASVVAIRLCGRADPNCHEKRNKATEKN